MISPTVTAPSPSASTGLHCSIDALPRAMFTARISSLTVTVPSRPQSPRHAADAGSVPALSPQIANASRVARTAPPRSAMVTESVLIVSAP
jgi:hypothetical protein